MLPSPANEPGGTARPRTVLGIDPGLTRCGIGVVSGTGSRLRHVAHDTLRTDAATDLAARLAQVFDGLEQAIAEHRPDVVAVERVLFSRNVRTAMATGQAAGVALLAAHRAGVVVSEITPTSVKATVAGQGDADKDAVARMVALQLDLAEPPRPADAADALAVAMAAVLQSGPTAAPAARNTGAGNPAQGGWEAHLADRGLQVVGGTGAPGGGSRDAVAGGDHGSGAPGRASR